MLKLSTFDFLKVRATLKRGTERVLNTHMRTVMKAKPNQINKIKGIFVQKLKQYAAQKVRN